MKKPLSKKYKRELRITAVSILALVLGLVLAPLYLGSAIIIAIFLAIIYFVVKRK